jgi:hypothetical protein
MTAMFTLVVPVHVPVANLRIYYSKRAAVYLHVVTVWLKHEEIKGLLGS